MGLLSSVKGGLQKAGNVVAKAVTTAGNTITAGIEKVTGQTYGRTTPQEFSSSTFGKVTTAGIVATGTAAAVLAAAPAVIAATPKIISSAGKTAGSVASAHPVATAVTVGVVAPAVATSKKLQQTVTKGVKELPSFGAQLGMAIDDPSKLGEFLKEHPVTSAGAGILAAYGIGKAVAPVAGAIITSKSIKEQTEDLRKFNESVINPNYIPPTAGTATTELPKEKPTATVTEAVPTTTPTEELTKKRKKYKKKTSLGAQGQKISQRVNVIVSQRQTAHNKRYLNRELLIN